MDSHGFETKLYEQSLAHQLHNQNELNKIMNSVVIAGFAVETDSSKYKILDLSLLKT